MVVVCEGMTMIHWVIDLDGVMWRGSRPIEGSADAVANLLGRGDRVLFCTNNSMASGAARATRLVDRGMPAGVEVVTSADAACTLVQRGEKVLVFGSAGLAEALADHGADVVRITAAVARTTGGPDVFDAVVVGLTREFDYAQLDFASQVVRGGARLLATNTDPTFPAADRLQPGTGSLLAAVEAASGAKATVAGKPEPPMARLICGRLGSPAGRAIVVGDRPDTDGRLAQQMGLPFALVLSGVTEAYSSPRNVPVAMVAQDLASLVAGKLLSGEAPASSVDGGAADASESSAGALPVRR